MLQKSLRGLTPTTFWLTPEALTATLLLKMNRGVLVVAQMTRLDPMLCLPSGPIRQHRVAVNENRCNFCCTLLYGSVLSQVLPQVAGPSELLRQEETRKRRKLS